MTRSGNALEFFSTCLCTDQDECIIWPFSRNNRGYAQIRMQGYDTTLAHRIMCIIINGPPPTSKHHAAHGCGNGTSGCVNPKHVGWKTSVDNAQDKFQHGTQRFGDNHQNAKLTTNEALAIKYSNESRNTLSVRFNTSIENVRDIQNGRRWRHLP